MWIPPGTHGRVLSLHLRVSGSLPQAELLTEGEKTEPYRPLWGWPQPLPLLTLPQPHWPLAPPPRAPNCFLYTCSLVLPPAAYTSSFPLILTTLIVCLLDYRHLSRCELVSHRGLMV